MDSEDGCQYLQPLGAKINHSCCPNSQWHIKDGIFYEIAIRSIKPGEEILHLYGDDDGHSQDSLFQCNCGLEELSRTYQGILVSSALTVALAVSRLEPMPPFDLTRPLTLDSAPVELYSCDLKNKKEAMTSARLTFLGSISQFWLLVPEHCTYVTGVSKGTDDLIQLQTKQIGNNAFPLAGLLLDTPDLLLAYLNGGSGELSSRKSIKRLGSCCVYWCEDAPKTASSDIALLKDLCGLKINRLAIMDLTPENCLQ